MTELLQASRVMADELAGCVEGNYRELTIAHRELGEVVITVSRAKDSPRLMLDKERAFNRQLKGELAGVTRVAEKFGWNGVENSKFMDVFLDGELTSLAEFREKTGSV